MRDKNVLVTAQRGPGLEGLPVKITFVMECKGLFDSGGKRHPKGVSGSKRIRRLPGGPDDRGHEAVLVVSRVGGPPEEP